MLGLPSLSVLFAHRCNYYIWIELRTIGKQFFFCANTRRCNICSHTMKEMARDERKPVRNISEWLLTTNEQYFYIFISHARVVWANTFKLLGCVSIEFQKSIESSANNWFDFCAYYYLWSAEKLFVHIQPFSHAFLAVRCNSYGRKYTFVIPTLFPSFVYRMCAWFDFAFSAPADSHV